MNDNDMIERLRVILEHQRARVVTRAEAAEIGESLIVFFKVLGESAASGQQV
jgi:hypothetical protein